MKKKRMTKQSWGRGYSIAGGLVLVTLTLQSLLTSGPAHTPTDGIFRFQNQPEPQDGAHCETSLLTVKQVFANQWVMSR